MVMKHAICGAVVAAVMMASSEEGRAEVVKTEDGLELRHQGQVLWALHFGEIGQKPYFHPLAAVGRQPFTAHRPKDHPWHRGLWFSWKYIDGLNYWEEDKESGLSKGRTRVKGWQHEMLKDQMVRIEMDIDYAPAGQEQPLLSEKRVIVISPPSDKGHYHLDWHAEFSAVGKGVELNRTPPPGQPNGKSWGGYAGLSLRMNPTARDGQWFNSAAQQGDAVNRQAAHWLVYGLPDQTGLLMMDHPDNPKPSSKWYIFAKMPFFSPVPVHDSPLTVVPGTPLKLAYRLVVMPTIPSPELANAAWKQWLKEFPAAPKP